MSHADPGATAPLDAGGLCGMLSRASIVPVVVLDAASDAERVARALLAGGLSTVEVALRTPASLDVLSAMTSVAGLTVGAGTVTTPAQATEAVAAGAQFLVSPGLTTALAEWTQAHKLAYLPGVATPSELMYAVNAGFNLVKFFPADLLGGPAGVKALAGPFPEVSFVPSGGVTLQNAATYLSLPQVPAVSGTWLIDKAAISSKDWDKVTATVKASMQELRQLTG